MSGGRFNNVVSETHRVVPVGGPRDGAVGRVVGVRGEHLAGVGPGHVRYL